MKSTIGPTLGEFRCAGDEVFTAGTFSVHDDGPQLELLGCLETDRLPPETTGAAYPRTVPEHGQHDVVTGLLRTGEPVTLLGVAGKSWGTLGVFNGRSWQRTDDRFSGDSVSMWAEHAVMRAYEATEPEFDEITFHLAELDSLLGRTQTWWPTDKVEEVAGYVPLVIVPVSDYEFDLGGFRLSFRQVVRRSADSALEDAASTLFAIQVPGRRVRFTECVNLLNELRLLAEFGRLGHASIGPISGTRFRDGGREEFPIYSWLQRQGANRTSERQQLAIAQLAPADGSRQIDKLGAEISASDRDRAELIKRWCGWLEGEGNREAMIAFLRSFHGSTRADAREVFRSTIGVLEDLARMPTASPRVAPVPVDELEARETAIAAVEVSLGDGYDGAAWAIERLRSGVAGKGLGRRLSELLEEHEGAFRRVLRSSPTSHNVEYEESPEQTGRAFAATRGKTSHGVGESVEDLVWRADQVQLVFLGIVLCELGYDDSVVESIIHAKSHRKRWWDPDR